MTNLDSVLKNRGVTLLTMVGVQGYGLPSGHISLWELDCKQGWLPKNQCLQTVVLEKILESPLDCKESKPVDLKGDPPWIFTGRTDAEAEAPVFWSSDVKSWLIGKDPDAGKDWEQKKRALVDEVVWWPHQYNAHELGQTSGDIEGQGGLAYCSPWGCKESPDWPTCSIWDLSFLTRNRTHTPCSARAES